MVLPTTVLKPLLPPFFIFSALLIEDWASTPTCTLSTQNVGVPPNHHNKESLKVMIVANLLLSSSHGGPHPLLNYFRDYFLSNFFLRSFYRLKPDLLLVLGDIIDRGGGGGVELDWIAVLHRFNQVIGPFLEVPHHVVLGDKEVGDCVSLDVMSVYRVSRVFPGLDSSGCASFEIGNVSFVSLNSVPLLCDGGGRLRFGVEKAIEKESSGLRSREEGEGPVVLAHFPLHRMRNDGCTQGRGRGFVGDGGQDLSETISPNVTEYIFHALKPRIIFSAHVQEFCDYTHVHGTREVTAPAMTWKARDDPGFIVATFYSNTSSVSVSYCSVARESHVLIVYASLLVLFLVLWLGKTGQFVRSRRH